jgi:hypothetical protein
MDESIFKQQKKIEGIVTGLVQELRTMAPHPDHPGHDGPLFSFNDIDREPGPIPPRALLPAFAHANTNAAFGRGRVVSRTFNKAVARRQMMDAYRRDLPRRMGLERWIAYYQRKFFALEKQIPACAPSMAA